jgi:hypothetical protein
MNFPKIMIIGGSIIMLLGILFIAQSLAAVGPEVSFMYRNPEWSANGSITVAIGAVVVAYGITMLFKQRDIPGEI